MRPSQWLKNIVVFAAFFFSINESWNFNAPIDALGVFIEFVGVFLIFCVLSGVLYIINDIKDIEFDRNHPSKRFRPIASSEIPTGLAAIFSFLIILLLVIISFSVNRIFGYCIIGYTMLTLSYSFMFKNFVILDVAIIAIGFVIRVVSGAVAADVPISLWLYICAALGALVLALSKRRTELVLGGRDSLGYRRVLKFYSVKLIDWFLWIVTTSLILAYAFYTFTAANLPTNHFMVLTVPIVVFGVFRFLYLLNTGRVKEQPEDTFIKDRLLLITVLTWVIMSVIILSFYRP